MNKRFIVIVIILLILLLFAGGFWFAASKKNKKQPPVAETAQTGIKKIIDEPVISPVPAFDNNSIWYFNTEGRLFRVNLDGSSVSEFSLPSLNNRVVKEVLWPKVGSDFIVVTANGTGEAKYYYDSNQKKYVLLPDQMADLKWLEDGKRIVYIWRSADNTTQQIATANADVSGYKILKSVFWPDLNVFPSPDGKTVLLIRSKIEGDINKIYSVDLNSGTFDTVINEGKNLSAVWLPKGNKFLFLRALTGEPSKIFLYDFSQRRQTDLNISTSLEKVAFDSEGKNLYAAISKVGSMGEVFVKIDINALKQEVYFTPPADIKVKNLTLIGDNLYFTSVKDNKFYMVSK